MYIRAMEIHSRMLSIHSGKVTFLASRMLAGTLSTRRAVALLLLLLVWVSCCLGAISACRSCESCVPAHVAVDFRVNIS